jgi:putative ABC transport system permease protein
VGLRDLVWRRRRFLIAVLATALVFAMTLLCSGMSASIRNEGRRIIRGFEADRWLVPTGVSGPFTARLAVPARVAEQAARLPGVEQADPVALVRTTITGAVIEDVNVVGHVPGHMGTPRIHDGRAVRHPGEIVVDTALGLDIGDRVEVAGQRMEIVGTASKVSFLFGSPTIFMDLTDTQRFFFGGQPVASTIVVQGVPERSLDGYLALDDDAVAADLERILKKGAQSIDFMQALLWIVAAGIIGSIVYLTTLERVRDFAVLKAAGASNRALFSGLLLQALVLSVASAVVAAVVAQVLAPTFPAPVELVRGAYVALGVLATAVAVVASLLGLRRAVSVDPALAFGGR